MRSAAMVVPHLDFPETCGARSQWFAGIGDADGFIAVYLAAVPQVPKIILEKFFAAGDENLIGGLPLIAFAVMVLKASSSATATVPDIVAVALLALF